MPPPALRDMGRFHEVDGRRRCGANLSTRGGNLSLVRSKQSRCRIVLVAAWLVRGCSGDGPDASTQGSTGSAGSESETSDDSGALRETLRLDHLQALGTHNSYHLAPSAPIQAWAYSHRPLDEQLSIGVRQFELDLYRNAEAGDFDVYHVAQFDEETTCSTLTDCLTSMLSWSQAHPHHHPIVVLLEPKDTVGEADAAAFIDALESTVSGSWSAERMLLPAAVAREHGSLRAGLEAEGWPLLDEVRGRALFVLHTSGALRDELVSRGTAQPLFFPDAMGDLDADYAAFHSMNDPIDDAQAIQTVVSAGHLVRTRSDADNVEPTAGDVTRRDAALESGAHFISTDWPEPTPSGYVVTIPDGAPSRCNPLTAPPDCTSTFIENPTTLGGG